LVFAQVKDPGTKRDEIGIIRPRRLRQNGKAEHRDTDKIP
jgi:hypothetical protein